MTRDFPETNDWFFLLFFPPLCVGAQTFPNIVYRFVDIRDVALAHILAFEVPSANGRYCLVAHTLLYAQLLDILHKLYPTLTVAQK